MDILDHEPVISNSSRKIHHIFDITAPNPFTALSSAKDKGRGFLATDKIIFQKMAKCNTHCIKAYLMNVFEYENLWRIFELIHYIIPKFGYTYPNWYQPMLKQFANKKFDTNVVNGRIGRQRLIDYTYTLLHMLNDYMVTGNNPDKFVLNMNNHTINDIKTLSNAFFKVIKRKTACTCDDYTEFSGEHIKYLKRNYRRVVKKRFIDTLNMPKLNHHDKSLTYREKLAKFKKDLDIILTTPPVVAVFKRCNVIDVPYDFLTEDIRVKVLKRASNHGIGGPSQLYSQNGKDKTQTNGSMLVDPADDAPTLYRSIIKPNVCFVCDDLLLLPKYHICIKEGEIFETKHELNQNFKYDIIQRCVDCKKIIPLFQSNHQTIMARHMKWMTFYNGHLDEGSILQYVPKDVLKVIVMMYEHLRGI